MSKDKKDKDKKKSKKPAAAAKVDKKADKKSKSKKADKAPKAPKFVKLTDEQAAELTSKLFSISKKLKKAKSEKDKKKLYPKALKYIDQANTGSKKKDFPRMDKAYNRVFDRLPKEVVDSMPAGN